MEITRFFYDTVSHILKIFPKEDVVYVTDLSVEKMAQYIEYFANRDTIIFEEAFTTEEGLRNRQLAEDIRSGKQVESMKEFLRDLGLE